MCLRILCAQRWRREGRAGFGGGKLFIVNYLCRSKIHTEGEGHEKENRERGGGKRKEKRRNEEGKHPARIVDRFTGWWEHRSDQFCYYCLQFKGSLCKKRGE